MHALIVAAGSSRRMGFDKLLAPLAGQPVLWHSLRAMAACPEVESLSVVTRAELLPLVQGLAESACGGKPARVLLGGAERHLSVWAGLQALGAETAYVAVHDAARPLVECGSISGCLALARLHGAASCAAPVADTLKRADAACMVAGGVDRAGLWAMQTPQVFALPLLMQAYQRVLASGELVTDEVSAVELLNKPVALFHNQGWNFKITYPADIALAELIMAGRTQGAGAGRPPLQETHS